jgi:hypothetical protein
MFDDLRARLYGTLEGFTNNDDLIDAELDDIVDALLPLFDVESQPEPDLAEQMRHRPTGVYRLFWHRGGCSVAAVGMLSDGSRWYAPANWTSPDAGGVASADWSPVKSAELIESFQGSRRKRPRKGAT